MLQEQPSAQYDALQIARELANNLAQMHAQGITHGNLNSQQILLDQAKQHAMIEEVSGSGPELSPRWLSPERVDRKGNVHAATPQSDVYSLGLVLWCLASREQPFPQVIEFESCWTSKVQSVHRFTGKHPYSRAVLEMIHQCWEAPYMRPSAQTVLFGLSDPEGLVNCFPWLLDLYSVVGGIFFSYPFFCSGQNKYPICRRTNPAPDPHKSPEQPYL